MFSQISGNASVHDLTVKGTVTGDMGVGGITGVNNGGSSLSSVTKAVNTVINLNPYKPTREGYTFGGWYSDS